MIVKDAKNASQINVMPLISIIIPVYKVEAYLRKCLDSVLAQTYKSLEIILVDDGSPDNCGQICDEYAEKDERVKVIHKKNGGVSAARNSALDIVKGEFICFIDSDDWVTEDYVKILYESLAKYNTDISISGITYFYESNNLITTPYKIKNKEGVWNKEQAINILMYQKEFLPSPYAKLYKSAIWKNVRYPIGIETGEDIATIYLLFAKSNKISYCIEKTYFYVQREESALHRSFNKKLFDYLNILDEMLNYISVNLPACKMSTVCRLVSLNLYVYHQLKTEYKMYLSSAKRIENNVKKYRFTVIFDKNAKLPVRIACLLSYFGFSLVRFAFSLVKRNGEI